VLKVNALKVHFFFDVSDSVSLLLGGSQASPVCASFKSSLELKVSIEHCWNNSKRGKPKYPHGI